MTCQLEREGRQASYILSLVPHWDVRQTVTSTFDAAAGAFRGHASVVDHLRSEGWTLASYTVAP